MGQLRSNRVMLFQHLRHPYDEVYSLLIFTVLMTIMVQTPFHCADDDGTYKLPVIGLMTMIVRALFRRTLDDGANSLSPH